ncbi:MAG: hypothetical protein DMG21_22140 [Acidobacteria bacterium]|nr:MAG: hypothetical protein DMG21_22140 [Acidobacteriota bacterium]
MGEEEKEQGTVRYVRCAACGTWNPGTGDNCSHCGKPLKKGVKESPSEAHPPSPKAPAQAFCSNCRKPLPLNSKFCGYCGAPLPAATAPSSKPEEPGTPAQPVATTGLPKKVETPTSKVPRSVPPPPVLTTPPRSPRRAIETGPPSPPLGELARGTQGFAGLRPPTIEASIIEIKPDGSRGKKLSIGKQAVIGRAMCDANYPEDALLSARHASLENRGIKVILKDLGSQNGTFIKQRKDSELSNGDIFLVGRELFRFVTKDTAPPAADMAGEGTLVMTGAPMFQASTVSAKLERIQINGQVAEEFKLEKPETVIGRSSGDLVFKNDPYMSGKHAKITQRMGVFLLEDCKSRNGVYRRIQSETEVVDGDEFFLGEELFRVEIKTVEA